MFMSACTTIPEPENVEDPKPTAETCQQENNEECPPSDRMRDLRDSILKGKKIRNSEEANANITSTIEPE